VTQCLTVLQTFLTFLFANPNRDLKAARVAKKVLP
jgi:hypothetical protein